MMDGFERRSLLPQSYLDAQVVSQRNPSRVAFWWLLSAAFAGLAGWMLTVNLNAESTSIFQMQLQSRVQDVVRSPDLTTISGNKALSVTSATTKEWTLPQRTLPPVQPRDASQPVFTSSIPLAGTFLAVFTLIAGFIGFKSREVAMAPFLGTVQPVDKGADPNAGASDQESEQHRIDQRVVFNSERWRKHRSGSRFSRALQSMPQSYVIRHLVNPVIAIALSTAGLCAAQLYFGTDVFNLPTSLFSLSAPSLGLLLVFRTNASYERWDGARKMIGLVKNRSEDLTRQICTRFPADRPELKAQMLRYIQAFFFALKVHLRGGPGGFEDDNNLIEDLTPILKPNELELLLKATNRPGHIMCCMTQIVKEAGLDGAALFCLDQNLTTFEDVLGGCERILRTPIPLSYTRMTTRFLFVWLLLLPLALSGEILKLDHDIWLTIPAVSFIAFALLGIEEVGVQIEEPFTILPMEAYAAGSRANTQGIFNQMNDVAKIPTSK